MFFHLLFIHTFRPFLKYNPATSPLPVNVSPRKLCTQAASMISKLLRLYKRSYGLRQICNIAVYICHSACTIHLLNLPEKNAKRDIVHGLKHLEEIAEGWVCARRTLAILSVLSRKWNVELPTEAQSVLERTNSKFGPYRGGDTSPTATMQALKVDAEAATQQQSELQAPSTFTDGEQVSYFTPNGSPDPQNARQTNNGVSLPHHSAQDLQYPSRQANVSSTMSGSPAQAYERNTALTSMASPTAMFGGIDQLLQEGHDWTLRDQQNLALGFDNWGAADWVDLGWMSGRTNGGVPVVDVSSGGAYGAPSAGMNPELVAARMNEVNDMTMMNAMNGQAGMNRYPINGFIDNESDWYN